MIYKHTVMGIDPSSTKLAVVVTSPGGENFYTWKLPKSKWKKEECGYAYHTMTSMLHAHPGAYVFLEAPVGVPGRGGFRAVIPQSQVGGAILAACRGADVRLVENTLWKSRLLGNGQASKFFIQSRLRTRWPAAYQAAITKRGKVDQDICDAAFINIYGRFVVRDGDGRQDQSEEVNEAGRRAGKDTKD